MISQQFAAARSTSSNTKGFCLSFPFGQDFTHDEQTIIDGLQWLKPNTSNSYLSLVTIIKALFVKPTEQEMVYLKMMKLENCSTLQEKLYAKLFVYALRQ